MDKVRERVVTMVRYHDIYCDICGEWIGTVTDYGNGTIPKIRSAVYFRDYPGVCKGFVSCIDCYVNKQDEIDKLLQSTGLYRREE